MSQLIRWGFDRAAGRKSRPVPLVRRVFLRVAMAPVGSAMGPVARSADAASLLGSLKIVASSPGKFTRIPDPQFQAKARVETPDTGASSGVERVSRAARRTRRAVEPRSAGTIPLSPAVPPERLPMPPAAAPADPARPVRARRFVPPAQRIDISAAPSDMERQFTGTPMERAPAPVLRDGMAHCRCHPEGLVPDWFGRDCIEPRCQLKVCAS